MSLSDCPSCWETPCVCSAPVDDSWIKEALAYDMAVEPGEIFTGKAAFKNFHRSLCARFGYTHDEQFWWRDLISLEEHICSQIQPKAKVLSELALRDELKEIPLCYPCGTGKKLVRGGSLRSWVVTNPKTNAATLLADLNQNYVNSTISATITALVRVAGSTA